MTNLVSKEKITFVSNIVDQVIILKHDSKKRINTSKTKFNEKYDNALFERRYFILKPCDGPSRGVEIEPLFHKFSTYF